MKSIHKVDDGSGDPKLKIIGPREFPTLHRREITTEVMKVFPIDGVQLKQVGGLHPPTFNYFLLIVLFGRGRFGRLTWTRRRPDA